MASPTHWPLLVAAITLIANTTAGPLPNITNVDIGLKEGSCALGDVVYLAGDEFPGAGPCERCTCAAGGVTCARQRCEPRPGCKALHRPDHCCPIYQCECEQEGRVYGNGEKLVDPADPCRVCYCQGGEVVCRRIACFVRDDCRPRLVPGRCCPEYDNCPLRGVTTIPGVAPSIASISTSEDVKASAAPVVPKENIKQEITIKEITPVSEIPVITEVKIKEILPSPSIEVTEYASSKSPLIPREATSESPSREIIISKAEPSIVQEFQSSPSTPDLATKSSESFMDTRSSDDATPSRISLSTQDSINSDIYPSVPSVATTGVPTVIIPDVVIVVGSTKTPMIEDEDLSLLDHNPAFPPIPDDLSVFSNHESDNVPEQNIDSEHLSSSQEGVSVASETPTEPPTTKESLTKTTKEISEAIPLTTERVSESSTELNIIKSEATESTKGSSMLNLRSAIPTEILNAPSIVPEDITRDIDETVDTTIATNEPVSDVTTLPSTEVKSDDDKQGISFEHAPTSVAETESDVTESTEIKEITFESQRIREQSTSQPTVTNSDIVTEANPQTELSSSPISNENQEETVDTVSDKADSTTVKPLDLSEMSTKISFSPEVITVSRTAPSNLDNQSIENVETTEFLIRYDSSESATDVVELIKISAEPEKNAAIIESASGAKNNVLTDLINLVGDVASMSDHTEHPRHTAISESEELIPVNAGYKSKNSNWNVNSITEIPTKSKNQTPGGKQKIVEIEDDEAESITDHSPPNDKVEPTTRRPIIDNVSDDNNMPENKTEKKDIEIITQSYVPTINRRPTKVVMKKNNEKPALDETPTEADTLIASAESATEIPASRSAESVSTPVVAPAAENTLSTEDAPSAEGSDSAEKSHTSDASSGAVEQ